LTEVQTKDLPDALRETGLSEVRLVTGEKIIVKDKVFCGISQQNQEVAFGWLKENGFDDIIKNNVVLSFKRGEDQMAETIIHQLEVMGLRDKMAHKKEVHWQTLRAFVTEQLQANSPLPHDVFGVHIVPTATIKR